MFKGINKEMVQEVEREILANKPADSDQVSNHIPSSESNFAQEKKKQFNLIF